MQLDTLQDHVIHHSANVAAVAFPLVSLWLHAPQAFTYLTSGLGVVWYSILIAEKITYHLQKWRDRAKEPSGPSTGK